MNQKNPETFQIGSEDSNQRIDAFLSGIYSNISRSYIQKQIKAENVLLNGLPVKASHLLKNDDSVSVSFDTTQKLIILPENITLDIKYEDEKMLVVNKPADMLTHPTSIEKSGTLVNALLFYTNGKLSDCNGLYRPGIVHRLDRNTSGLLMISKDNETYEALKKQMQDKITEKKYYAVVCGQINNDSGTITADIGRHPTRPEKMSVVESGKPSVTHYKVLERFENHTFVEINLETGRTHQIRVHMASLGHPVANDTMYGAPKIPVKTKEQVLQAFSLKFISPFDNEPKHIVLDFDDDIIKTLNYLRSKK